MRISDWSSDVCSSDLRAWSPHPRSAAQLRCANDDRLVQVRQGSGAGNDQADHMAWPRQPRSHLLVYRGRSGTAGSGVSSDNRSSCSGDLLMTGLTFPALLQRFLPNRLCTQMEARRTTIAGYRNPLNRESVG